MMIAPGSSLHELRNLVQTDFTAVNKQIEKSLSSNIALVQQISHHIIHKGGKRLRPLLVLLSAKSLAYENNQHIKLATIIEFLHTATLLHDDVVDHSQLRRGGKTANFIWGNEASILVGDFLYSRAFQMMADLKIISVIDALAQATNQIASGEVLQLMHRNNPNTTEQNYMEVIYLKTAKLFEVSAQTGALIAQATPTQERALTHFGKHVGMAYQLIDDVLDFSANQQELGKSIGDDLAEGKPTLPLIYALQHSNAKQQHLINDVIRNGGLQQMDIILQIVHETGALQYTQNIAQHHVEQALEILEDLPESPYCESLATLANFVLTRKS